MELVAVFLADDAGINDRGAMRLDGGYLGWLPQCGGPVEPDGPGYAVVALGRGVPDGPAHFDFTVTTPAQPVQFDADLDLPDDALWWFSLRVPAQVLAGTSGQHRISVSMSTGGEVRSSVWYEYDVRAG